MSLGPLFTLPLRSLKQRYFNDITHWMCVESLIVGRFQATFAFRNVVGLKLSVVTDSLQSIKSVSELNWWELVQCVGRITSLMKKRVTVLNISAASPIDGQSMTLFLTDIRGKCDK